MTAPATVPDASAAQVLARPYLLVTCITCHVDAQGRRYLDPLWARDLRAHFRYLPDFTLAAPRVDGEPPVGAVRIDNDPDFAGCRYVDLPSPRSFLEALRQVPGTWRRLRPAVTSAAILHSGVNGWPLADLWRHSVLRPANRAIAVPKTDWADGAP